MLSRRLVDNGCIAGQCKPSLISSVTPTPPSLSLPFLICLYFTNVDCALLRSSPGSTTRVRPKQPQRYSAVPRVFQNSRCLWKPPLAGWKLRQLHLVPLLERFVEFSCETCLGDFGLSLSTLEFQGKEGIQSAKLTSTFSFFNEYSNLQCVVGCTCRYLHEVGFLHSVKPLSVLELPLLWRRFCYCRDTYPTSGTSRTESAIWRHKVV